MGQFANILESISEVVYGGPYKFLVEDYKAGI